MMLFLSETPAIISSRLQTVMDSIYAPNNSYIEVLTLGVTVFGGRLLKKWRWFSCYIVSNACDSMDCSPPGSSVHGISRARVLEGVVTSFSRGSSQPRDLTWVSYIAGRLFID